MEESKKTFYRIKYKVTVGMHTFITHLDYFYDGFVELLDFESIIKGNLSKYKNTAKLEDIISTEKMTV